MPRTPIAACEAAASDGTPAVAAVHAANATEGAMDEAFFGGRGFYSGACHSAAGCSQSEPADDGDDAAVVALLQAGGMYRASLPRL